MNHTEHQSNHAENQEPQHLRLDIQLAQSRLTRDEERERLERIYDPHMVEALAGDTEFVAVWQERVRSQTSLLRNADAVSMRLFTPNIAEQPDFPVPVEVVFQKSVQHARSEHADVRGAAERGTPLIRLVGEPPGLYDQTAHFIETGLLSASAAELNHELIHKYHFSKNIDTDTLASEAHAYANGIVEPLALGTVEATIDHLEKDYGAKPEEAQSLVEDILFLQAVGADPAIIGDQVASFNPAMKSYWLMREYIVKPYMKDNNISDEGKQQLTELYLLRTECDNLRARNLFFDEADKYLGTDTDEGAPSSSLTTL